MWPTFSDTMAASEIAFPSPSETVGLPWLPVPTDPDLYSPLTFEARGGVGGWRWEVGWLVWGGGGGRCKGKN